MEKKVFVGPEQTFANDFLVIPVWREKELIAFGLLWNSQIVSVKGYEKYLPLAVAELLRERPNIIWKY